jgi:hypothetical protein
LSSIFGKKILLTVENIVMLHVWQNYSIWGLSTGQHFNSSCLPTINFHHLDLSTSSGMRGTLHKTWTKTCSHLLHWHSSDCRTSRTSGLCECLTGHLCNSHGAT